MVSSALRCFVLLVAAAAGLRLPVPTAERGRSPAARSPTARSPAARSSAVRLCSADEYSPQDYEENGWYEDALTCVEFEAGDELRLGVYIKYTVTKNDPHIRPLCASSEDDGVRYLLQDEAAPAVPLSAVRRVLDPDVVFVSEMQAGGGQGLGNPHGEHGEECYDLRDVGISEGVRVVVREGRDSERVL